MYDKIDYSKPLNFISLDPQAMRDQNGNSYINLLTAKVSVFWHDIVAVEEMSRKHLVNNDPRPMTVIRTRWTPNGYIALAEFDEVNNAWEGFIKNSRLGLGGSFMFN